MPARYNQKENLQTKYVKKLTVSVTRKRFNLKNFQPGDSVGTQVIAYLRLS